MSFRVSSAVIPMLEIGKLGEIIRQDFLERVKTNKKCGYWTFLNEFYKATQGYLCTIFAGFSVTLLHDSHWGIVATESLL